MVLIATGVVIDHAYYLLKGYRVYTYILLIGTVSQPDGVLQVPLAMSENVSFTFKSTGFSCFFMVFP